MDIKSEKEMDLALDYAESFANYDEARLMSQTLYYMLHYQKGLTSEQLERVKELKARYDRQQQIIVNDAIQKGIVKDWNDFDTTFWIRLVAFDKMIVSPIFGE